jgi:hypothetical protein
VGKFPDLMGAVPDMGTNPVPDGGRSTDTKVLLTLGAGLGEWVDVGISSSRGLYSTVKLVRAGAWSLSLSPAYFRVTSAMLPFSTQFPDTVIRASNLNLTGLLAFRPGDVDGVAMEAYAGSGINRYKVEIRDRWRTHDGWSPTLLAGVIVDGVSLDLWRPNGEEGGTEESGGEGAGQTVSVGLELDGAWITQRNGRRDLVIVGRVQLTLRSWPAW